MTSEQILQAMQTMILPIHTQLNRIDGRLDRLDARMDELEECMNGLEHQINRSDERMDGLEGQIGRLDGRVDHMQQDIRRTRVLVEDQDHKISLIAEQHSETAVLLDKVGQIDELRGRASTLEHVVADHTTELLELKKTQ